MGVLSPMTMMPAEPSIDPARGERFVVHGHVDLVGGQEGRREPARDDGLERLPLGRPARAIRR